MPSVKKFLTINISFYLLGYIYEQSYIFSPFIITNVKNWILFSLLAYTTRNIKHVKNINNHLQPKTIDIINGCIMSGIEYMTIKYSKKQNDNYLLDVITFIPKSFIFEILFDLIHYFFHRVGHLPGIYKYSHKKHHEYTVNTNLLATFHQDPIDLIFTNFLPVYLVSFIVTFSYIQFYVFLVYKTFIELGGHLGKKSSALVCFPQCVWLPKLFNIDLYALDHYVHHTKNNCNYAKRFTLWDKVFGTFDHS